MGSLDAGSDDRPVLLVTAPLQDSEIKKLLSDIDARHAHLNLHIEFFKKDSDIKDVPAALLRRTKYITGFNKWPLPEQVPALEFVQCFSAGVNHLYDLPLYNWKLDDVKWCSASGVHGPIIGEYVVLSILAHFHKFLSAVEDLQGSKHWPAFGFLPRQKELYRKTVGIVGYGAIGRNVARLLTGFNVDIITLNSTQKKTKEERRQKEEFTVPGTGDIPGDIPVGWYSSNHVEEKAKFFAESDAIVVTAPYTPATKHLVDAASLKAMKSHAVIVNIARGELIDQDALVAALKNKGIGGAVLDVLTPEPYPADGPLLTDLPEKDDRERLIMTPHISGHTEVYNERVLEILVENLARLESGETLLNLIDRRKGY
jgi:phosphoglycerate dehydrogenase-like enzyme